MPIFKHRNTGFVFLVPLKNGFSLFNNTRDSDGEKLFDFDWDDSRYFGEQLDGMFVREPVERLASAFRNKILYSESDEIATKWAGNITNTPLSRIHTLKLKDLLPRLEELVSLGKSSPDRWERHFFPQQWQKEWFGISRLYDIRHDTEFLETLGLDPERKENRTDHLSFEITDDEKDWIRSIYRMDVELYDQYRHHRAGTTNK